jgi:putative SOS response-associated peptidase YedK
MCYDVAYLTKKSDRYASHYSVKPNQIEKIKSKTPPIYHVQGFMHPDLAVLTSDGEVGMYHWGLIPFWAKDSASATQLSNRTLNARGEEMFDKPSFRKSASSKRCLIMVDGFFEHRWHDGKSYPYYITHKDQEPFSLGGLWDSWKNPEGEILRSVSIVTTAANALLEKIHNNPKASEGPRMPLVLLPEQYDLWLNAPDDPVGKKQIEEIIGTCDPSFLTAWPVDRLRGKEYKGNIPELIKPRDYPDLPQL